MANNVVSYEIPWGDKMVKCTNTVCPRADCQCGNLTVEFAIPGIPEPLVLELDVYQ